MLFNDLQPLVVVARFNELKILIVFLVDLSVELVFAAPPAIDPLESVLLGVVFKTLVEEALLLPAERFLVQLQVDLGRVLSGLKLRLAAE